MIFFKKKYTIKGNGMQGYIESFDGSKLTGWFYDKSNLPNVPKLRISDESGERIINCSIYREDLDDLGLNNGYCGFSVNVSGTYKVTSVDGDFELKKHENFKKAASNSLKNIKSELFNKIKYVVTNKSESKNKLAVISSFLADPTFYSYQSELIRSLKKKGYYTVYVLPENSASPHCKEFNDKLFSDSDLVIVRDNFGYDFGSYATGYAYALDNCKSKFESVLFCNDSIVGPLASELDFLDDVVGQKFWGVTESYEHQYHIQSYFFGFDLSQETKATLEDFLFGRGMLYTDDKELVIKRFELSMTSYFQRAYISPKVLFPISMLMSQYIKNKSEYYELDEARFSSYFNVISDRIDFNVSHFLWRELYQMGFPFVKKELIRYNPTQYPYFHYLFRITIDCESVDEFTAMCF